MVFRRSFWLLSPPHFASPRYPFYRSPRRTPPRDRLSTVFSVKYRCITPSFVFDPTIPFLFECRKSHVVQLFAITPSSPSPFVDSPKSRAPNQFILARQRNMLGSFWTDRPVVSDACESFTAGPENHVMITHFSVFIFDRSARPALAHGMGKGDRGILSCVASRSSTRRRTCGISKDMGTIQEGDHEEWGTHGVSGFG